MGIVAVRQVSCEYLGFPILVSFHQCSIIIHPSITDTLVISATEAPFNTTFCAWIGSGLCTSVVGFMVPYCLTTSASLTRPKGHSAKDNASHPSTPESSDGDLLPPHIQSNIIRTYLNQFGDRGGTVVKVLCYKSEGRWFDPLTLHT